MSKRSLRAKPAAKLRAKPRAKNRGPVAARDVDPAVQAFFAAVSTSGFRKRGAQMWVQAVRLGKLLAIQQGTPAKEFPPGCCFLHANVPTVTSFCVRRVVEIDLDACSATIEIHGDEDLEAGFVVLPLETMGWVGFPASAVSVGVHFQGFAAPSEPAAPTPVTVPAPAPAAKP